MAVTQSPATADELAAVYLRGRDVALSRRAAAVFAWFLLLVSGLKTAGLWVSVVSELQSPHPDLSLSDAPYVLAPFVLHMIAFVLACGFLVRLRSRQNTIRVTFGNLLLAVVLLEIGSFLWLSF